MGDQKQLEDHNSSETKEMMVFGRPKIRALPTVEQIIQGAEHADIVTVHAEGDRPTEPPTQYER